jgi:hypothetical protein
MPATPLRMRKPNFSPLPQKLCPIAMQPRRTWTGMGYQPALAERWRTI